MYLENLHVDHISVTLFVVVLNDKFGGNQDQHALKNVLIRWKASALAFEELRYQKVNF